MITCHCVAFAAFTYTLCLCSCVCVCVCVYVCLYVCACVCLLMREIESQESAPWESVQLIAFPFLTQYSRLSCRLKRKIGSIFFIFRILFSKPEYFLQIEFNTKKMENFKARSNKLLELI